MRSFEALLLICSFLISSTTAIPHQRALQHMSVESAGYLKAEQQVFGLPKDEQAHHRSVSNPHFDARQNSVGVLFTTSGSEESVIHFWLPIGKKVYTRDSPQLPLHPTTARITSLINSMPSLANPEQLDRIQCEIWTASYRTIERGSAVPQRWMVSFTKKDELVKLASVEHGRFWLGGKEVESYECRA